MMRFVQFLLLTPLPSPTGISPLMLLLLHITFSQNNNLENEDDDVTEDTSTPNQLPEGALKKQASTHVAVSPDVVLASTGKAGRKEIDNLTLPKAITALSLKDLAKLKGESSIELPAKVVFTIKPEKFEVRSVACGSQTDEIYGKPLPQTLTLVCSSFSSPGAAPLEGTSLRPWMSLLRF